MQAIVSDALLRRIRHSLSSRIPKAKSSHIAESLAQALGHASNAALRAGLALHPWDRANLLPVFPGAFETRLRSFGPLPDGDLGAVLAQSLVEAGASADGPGYHDLLDSDSMPDHPWRHTGLLEFAKAAFLMQWRMGNSWIGIVDFVDNHSTHAGRDLLPDLAKGILAHRDADPFVAGFLMEYVAGAATNAGKLEAQDVSRWGDYVYWAYEPRIRAFIDMACRLWSPASIPSPDGMPGVPTRDTIPMRRNGYPLYPEAAISQAGGGLDAFSCGRSTIDSEATMAGLAAMAMFQAGAPLQTLRKFIGEVERAKGWDRVREVCGRWVSVAPDILEALDLPDAIRAATVRSLPVLERIVSEAYEIGANDIEVEIDDVLGKARVGLRKPDGDVIEDGLALTYAQGKELSIEFGDNPELVASPRNEPMRWACIKVANGETHKIRILDPKGTMKAIARHRAGMAYGELMEKGVAFVPGDAMGNGLAKALEAKGFVPTRIQSDGSLADMLRGAYRGYDAVVIDMRGKQGISDDDATMITRGILSGIVHVVVGASPEIREAIEDLKERMASPPSP